MKLFALNGSHKKTGGVNQLLIDRLFKGAADAGAECETVRLSKCTIKPCLACDYCQAQTGYACVHDGKDDFLGIIAKMKRADIVVFSTPVYVFQMSSLLKTFLERYHGRGKSGIRTISGSHLLFHDVERELCTKPFVSIIVSDNIERKTTENISRFFETFSRFMDAPHVGSIIRNGAFIFKPGMNNEKLKNLAGNVLKHAEDAGRFLAGHGFLTRKIESAIGASVLPVPMPVFNLMKRSAAMKARLLERAGTF